MTCLTLHEADDSGHWAKGGNFSSVSLVTVILGYRVRMITRIIVLDIFLDKILECLFTMSMSLGLESGASPGPGGCLPRARNGRLGCNLLSKGRCRGNRKAHS